MQGAVIDIVHGHDRRRRLGRRGRFFAETGGLGCRADLGQGVRFAHGIGAGQEGAPLLLVIEQGFADQRGQVEAQVLGIGRQQVAQGVDRHGVSFLGGNRWKRERGPETAGGDVSGRAAQNYKLGGQGLTAHGAVAGAQFVRLKRIKHA